MPNTTVTVNDVMKSSFRFLAMLKETKPQCSTLHRILSQTAHVEVSTVKPTLSDTDVRDMSRIRMEKQETASRSASSGRDAQRRRVQTAINDCQAYTTKLHVSGHSDKQSLHLGTREVPKTCPCRSPVGRMLCPQSPRLGATGPRKRGGDATPVPQWSTADIAGDDKNADSEGSSKDSTGSKTPAGRG